MIWIFVLVLAAITAAAFGFAEVAAFLLLAAGIVWLVEIEPYRRARNDALRRNRDGDEWTRWH